MASKRWNLNSGWSDSGVHMFTHFPLLSFSQVNLFKIVTIYKKRLLNMYFISLKFSLESTLLKVKLSSSTLNSVQPVECS